MRTQKVNRTPFYYALYLGERMETDEDGNYTGEKSPRYSSPVLYKKANVSPATGMSNTEQFGNLENYDKVIVTGDMSFPVNENSILWIETVGTRVPYNYIVKRVSRSKNGISIAVAKVKVETADTGLRPHLGLYPHIGLYPGKCIGE